MLTDELVRLFLLLSVFQQNSSSLFSSTTIQVPRIPRVTVATGPRSSSFRGSRTTWCQLSDRRYQKINWSEAWSRSLRTTTFCWSCLLKDQLALPYAVSKSSTPTRCLNRVTLSMNENNLKGLVEGVGAPAFLMCIIGFEVKPAMYARSSLFVTFLAMAYITPTLTLVARLTQFEMKRDSRSRPNC